MGRFADLSSYTPAECLVWEKLCSACGQVFATCRGLCFSFSIRGNELFVDRRAKSLTRATVIQTFRRAQELLANGEPLTGPKSIGTFGASYLLPIFQGLGLLPPCQASTKRLGRPRKIQSDITPEQA